MNKKNISECRKNKVISFLNTHTKKSCCLLAAHDVLSGHESFLSYRFTIHNKRAVSSQELHQGLLYNLNINCLGELSLLSWTTTTRRIRRRWRRKCRNWRERDGEKKSPEWFINSISKRTAMHVKLSIYIQLIVSWERQKKRWNIEEGRMMRSKRSISWLFWSP